MKNSRDGKHGGVSRISQSSARKQPFYKATEQVKIHDPISNKSSAVAEVEYPDRPGEPDCLHYLRTGMCGYGSSCRFNHSPHSQQYFKQGTQDASELPKRHGQPDCKFYLHTGTCKFGSSCRYHHPSDRYIMLNTLGLPMRQGEEQCSYYMRNGTCKFGINCKFDHPQLVSAGNSLSVMAHAAYESNALTTLPSSGMSSVSGFADSSTSKATYVSNTSMQVAQPVVPPPQAWSRYMGIMQQSTVPTILANPTSISQVQGFPSVSSLPDRPDQPECRDFMKTGRCKFGLDCKYHHPRVTTPVLPSSLGPLGLPSQSGNFMYSYYAQYGLYTYGMIPQLNYPWPGYLHGYNFGVPSGPSPLLNVPSSPYQWNLPIVLPAETAPATPSNHADPLNKGQSSNSTNDEHMYLNTLPSSSKVSRDVSRGRSN